MDSNKFDEFVRVKRCCEKFADNPNKLTLENLKQMLISTESHVLSYLAKGLIGSFFPIIEGLFTGTLSYSPKEVYLLMETLGEVFKKITIESTAVVFNFYTFFLLQLENFNTDEASACSEEYKLVIVRAITELFKCTSVYNFEELYEKANAPKFSQIVLRCCRYVTNEKNNDLRCASMRCILAVAKCLPTDDFNDIVVRDKVADIFMFFIPGISNTFSHLAKEDITIGHRILVEGLMTFGRLLVLIMQDYNSYDSKMDLKNIFITVSDVESESETDERKPLDDYARMKSMQRDVKWYRETDEKLKGPLQKFLRFTYHNNLKVRLALVDFVEIIAANCMTTMPRSMTALIEFLIILQHDEDKTVSSRSIKIYKQISSQLSSSDLDFLFENLEEDFYNVINSLPRCINSININEKLCALNLLIGYIQLFGPEKLGRVLAMPGILPKLVEGLLYITELEKSNISILLKYELNDLTITPDFKPPWINFRHFNDDRIKDKIELLCTTLWDNEAFNALYYPLYTAFLYEPDRRKEVIYLINSIVNGFNKPFTSEYNETMVNVMKLYTDGLYNNLELIQDVDKTNRQNNLEIIRNKIILVCVLTEGIGIVSTIMKYDFKPFLLNSLYILLERAGCNHYLISAAGLLSLHQITLSCGYRDINQLLNSNFGFYSFVLEQRLKKPTGQQYALTVLSVILKYCDVDMFQLIKPSIVKILIDSFSKYKAKYSLDYLQFFKTFIITIRKWFNVENRIEPIKSKLQKEMEYEQFKVTGIKEEKGSDKEETCEEKKKNRSDINEDLMEEEESDWIFDSDETDDSNFSDNGSDSDIPPSHIFATILVLKASLHYLPSRNRRKKLLVLQILERGIDILADSETELLKLIHKIWSPLAPRFQDNEPLIKRHSVRLLKSLARLSKEFIRMKTNGVLPFITQFLNSSATQSYLKDRGSAYRYTQEYKLQLEILESLLPILAYIDAHEKVFADAASAVYSYLSDKQPIPLQAAALDFFMQLEKYDPETLQVIITTWTKILDEYKINVDKIKDIIKTRAY